MCMCACVCICMQWQWVYSCSHSLHYITVPTGRPVNEALVRKKDANIKKNSSFVKKLILVSLVCGYICTVATSVFLYKGVMVCVSGLSAHVFRGLSLNSREIHLVLTLNLSNSTLTIHTSIWCTTAGLVIRLYTYNYMQVHCTSR